MTDAPNDEVLADALDLLRVLANAAENYGKHSYTETFYELAVAVRDARYFLEKHGKQEEESKEAEAEGG
jgi:hypothetical protein